MGLVNGGATLQRLMDLLLRGAHKWADKVLDDVIVYTMTFDDHLKALADVFGRFQRAGLTAMMEKCHFATDEIRIFGYLLQQGKIFPDPAKTEAIRKWPKPRTKKELKSFNGLCSFFRSQELC